MHKNSQSIIRSINFIFILLNNSLSSLRKNTYEFIQNFSGQVKIYFITYLNVLPRLLSHQAEAIDQNVKVPSHMATNLTLTRSNWPTNQLAK